MVHRRDLLGLCDRFFLYVHVVHVMKYVALLSTCNKKTVLHNAMKMYLYILMISFKNYCSSSIDTLDVVCRSSVRVSCLT
jgi:hypothetical protein